MILNELFSQTVPYEVKSESPEWLKATFEINGQQCEVTAGQMPADPEYGYPEMFNLNFGMLGEEEFEQGITGKGDQFAIFSTVIQIYTEYFKKYPPKCVRMTAVERNRFQLYIKMLQRLLPGWRIEQDFPVLMAYDPNLDRTDQP